MTKQLFIDLSDSDNDMIMREAITAVACGEYSNVDHAYESLWDSFENELHFINTHEGVTA
jgi:hypothetical protein